MALPNTGITTSIVAKALGAGSNDVGTLCAHSNINRWSKWKPIAYAASTGITEAILIEKNYGMVVHSSAYLSDLLTLIDGQNGIYYQKPLGAVSTPYRLGDFRNYEHYATIPAGTEVTSSSSSVRDLKVRGALNDGIDCYVNFKITENTPLNNFCIAFSNLYPATPLYLGIQLLLDGRNDPTGVVYACGSDLTLVTVNWNDTNLKTWPDSGYVKTSLFLTNKWFSQTSIDPSATDSYFYAIPVDENNCNPYYVTVLNEYAYNPQEFLGGVSMYPTTGTSSCYYVIAFDADGWYNGSPLTGGYAEGIRLQTSDSDIFTNILGDVLIGDWSVTPGYPLEFTGDIPCLSSGTTHYRLIANSSVLSYGTFTI